MSRATFYGSLLGLAALAAHAPAADFLVSSASEITTALSQAGPGDTLIMTDGVWTDQYIRFRDDGAPGNPITLRAQTPGGVTLNGTSRLEIGGDCLVVEGLRFEGGALTDGHVVRFLSGSVLATNSVFRDCAIIDYNPIDRGTRYFWVSLYGTNNTVENCRFENQDHSGVTVVVWGDWPNFHTIRNNHFLDRPVGGENGWETIRVGTSDFVDESSQTLVESNLFQRTDGEIEIISNKTGENTYRSNTFRECSATLTIRHGFSSTVEGNFFFGEGAGGSGGVRVIGPGHRVFNNYFEGLLGRTGGIIALEAGESNGANSGYKPMTDVICANNTFVDNADPAFALNRSFGGSRDVAPSGVLLFGNVISQPTEDVAIESNPGVSWDENYAFADGLGTANANGVTLLGSDPLSTGGDSLQRPAPNGPLDDALSSPLSLVVLDMDGQPRSTPADAGADEISSDGVTRAPLDPSDVGPSWWDSSPPTGVDPALAVFIEAELPTAILDPDNDGVIYTAETVSGASMGGVLVAPSGSRTDLGSGPHETLAVYTVLPPATGPYTVYVLARGFTGSSDSFFRPDSFNADPGITESTSNNGQFRWETGATIPYDTAEGPVDLRIGRREGGTEIDAIILYPESDLTTAELDSLLEAGPAEPCTVDVDGNGVVDFFDTLAYLRLFDAGDPAADLSGNGELNAFDQFRHINDLEAGCPE